MKTSQRLALISYSLGALASAWLWTLLWPLGTWMSFILIAFLIGSPLYIGLLIGTALRKAADHEL